MSPTSADFDDRLRAAMALVHAERLAEASEQLRALASESPRHAMLAYMHGLVQHRLGRSEDALVALQRAENLAPTNATMPEAAAAVLLALDRPAQAEQAARRALTIDPKRFGARLNLGLALEAQGLFGSAIEQLQIALTARPTSLSARHALVRSQIGAKHVDAALANAKHVSVLDDESLARVVAGDFADAKAVPSLLAFLAAIAERHPQRHEWPMRIATVLHGRGRSSEALAWADRALALKPDAREPLEMRAVSLIDRGELDEGLAIYRALFERADADADGASRYLILAHYDPAATNASLFAAHRSWVERFVAPFGSPYSPPSSLDPERTLRIGWLSPRFGDGPVASFFTTTLEAFDRDAFTHVLVSLEPRSGAATERFRTAADEWHDIAPVDELIGAARDAADVAALDRLRALDLDIVIDLAGHSSGNRLPVLAQRVAPLQICWLDYFDTTAVPTMDVWISDEWLTPRLTTQRYTERVALLASGRFCYSPPEAGPATFAGDGPATFGSFNRLAKLNDDVVATWAEILQRVPESMLEIGATLLDDRVAREALLARFARLGIAADRLRLVGSRSYADLLEAYRRIDVALDPFPFSGCTTTCDALWMGAAVVTWPGETFVSRQSASLLWRLGRTDWVAKDRADYVERAVALTRETYALRCERELVRETMRTQLCDAPKQAAELATLIRTLWRERCERA